MRFVLGDNIQQEIVLSLVVIMVIYRIVLFSKFKRLGRTSEGRKAVARYGGKMFLLSDFGITVFVILYAVTVAFKLSLLTVEASILVLIGILIFIYRLFISRDV